MSEIIRIRAANCESHLLAEIGSTRFRRRDVAQSYWHALNSGEKVDWAKVNKAIVERWNLTTLEWIKEQAWSRKCFEPRNVQW